MKFILLLTALTLGWYLSPSLPPLYVARPITEANRPIPTITPTPDSIQVVQTIVKEFAPEGKYVVREALDIAFCESGWRWDAINYNTNKTTDHNAFQINSVHTKRYGHEFKTNLEENVRVAHAIYQKQGWNPWVCYRKLEHIKWKALNENL